MTSLSFCKEQDGVFLLKPPKGPPSQASIPVPISFETVHEAIELDPFATEWMIAPVKKREGNPYADRVSIGRATNCDVVLRVPFISKMQAHARIVLPAQRFSTIAKLIRIRLGA